MKKSDMNKKIKVLEWRKLKSCYLIFFITLFVTKVVAQATAGNGISGEFKNYNPVPASPNVVAFQKYGDLPVDYNTGIPKIEIPIYTISLNGFSWPISMSYHASGIKSDNIATRVGLGWVINCAGVISGKKFSLSKGMAFDLQRDLNVETHVNPLDISQCYYNDTNDIDIADRIVQGQYRASPDFYYLNSVLINGKFLCGGGYIAMLPASDIKIEKLASSWKVKDDNGNLYEFLDCGENAVSTDGCVDFVTIETTAAYYLSKITTTKGEQIIFTYDDEIYTHRVPNLIITKTVDPYQLTGCYTNFSPEVLTCVNTSTSFEKRIKTIHTSTGIKVDFTYSGREDIPTSTKLNQIIISDNSNISAPVPIKNMEMEYEYFGTGTDPNNLQLKLKTISDKDNLSTQSQRHIFFYDNSQPLPSKLSPNYSDGLFTLSKAGTLNKIQYPTGGYTEFDYDVLINVGNLRIKSIRDFGSNNVETGYRSFEYAQPIIDYYPTSESEKLHYFGNPLNGGPVSTIIDVNPCLYYPFENILLSCNRTIKKSTPVINTVIELMGNMNTYGLVTEFFGRNNKNGKIEYKYGGPDYGNRMNGEDCHYLTGYGLFKGKKVYEKKANGSFSLLSKLENEHTIPSTNDSFFQNYSGNIKEARFWIKKVFRTREEMNFGCGPCFPKLYTQYNTRITSLPVYLTKSVEESYVDNVKLVTSSNYFYDNPAHLRPTRIETLNSKGELIKTLNKYPYDFTGNAVYNAMVNKNIISPVVEQVKSNVTKNVELQREKINFQFWNANTLIEPNSVQQSSLGNPLQTEVSINEYTANGQIKQLVSKNGIITSFIRGYNDQYVVAKIVGKSYIDAISQSGISMAIINNPSGENALRIELAKLRTLTGAFVNSYTYKPLVGITSETDLNNRTVYYEYDGFNRLAFVRDMDNNILKKVCYNFYGQIENCAGLGTNAVWENTGLTRCKVCSINPSYYTNITEMKQKDINPASTITYGTTRWVDFASSINDCLPESDWSSEGEPYCEVVNGANTGWMVINQRNLNPCSPNYNQIRPMGVSLISQYPGNNCYKPANWVATGETRCQIIPNNQYTGYVERAEINSEYYSTIPYGSIRWVIESYNPSSCNPNGCNSYTCSGEGYSCIAGNCELGAKVYTLSILDEEDPFNTFYRCLYHYVYSDNSHSPDFAEISLNPCL
jgi:hypothetical protein